MDSDCESGDEAEDEGTAYLCHSCVPDEDFVDLEDAMGQDIVCAFMAANCDLNDKEVVGDIADIVHHELVAFSVREQAIQRGAPTQRIVHSFRPPQSELTFVGRRAKVAIAKQNSTRTLGW